MPQHFNRIDDVTLVLTRLLLVNEINLMMTLQGRNTYVKCYVVELSEKYAAEKFSAPYEA